jgi:hypothetical protein
MKFHPSKTRKFILGQKIAEGTSLHSTIWECKSKSLYEASVSSKNEQNLQ